MFFKYSIYLYVFKIDIGWIFLRTTFKYCLH